MNIGKRIKTLRKQHNLTQVDLAERLETQQPQINRWENGVKVPSLPTLKKIAQLFNVSLDTMVMDAKDLDMLKLKDKSLFNKLKQIEKLSEKDKQAIITMIDSLASKSN